MALLYNFQNDIRCLVVYAGCTCQSTMHILKKLLLDQEVEEYGRENKISGRTSERIATRRVPVREPERTSESSSAEIDLQILSQFPVENFPKRKAALSAFFPGLIQSQSCCTQST